MIFLLDTNAISDLMNQHPTFAAHMAAVTAADEVITCAIVRGEILYGVLRLPAGKRKLALEAQSAAVLGILRCEAVTPGAADHYARIKAAQQQLGLALDENDLWIAGTAESLGATVVSRDQDMTRVVGLRVVDWSV